LLSQKFNYFFYEVKV